MAIDNDQDVNLDDEVLGQVTSFVIGFTKNKLTVTAEDNKREKKKRVVLEGVWAPVAAVFGRQQLTQMIFAVIPLLLNILYCLNFQIQFIESANVCHFDRQSFIKSFENATVVVTATVRQVTIHAPNSHLKAAKVRVKRVIKGKDILNKVSEIVIYGLGDIKKCQSVLYEKDTKVFLLSVRQGKFFLNPPVAPISLDILDMMDSIMRVALKNLETFDTVLNGLYRYKLEKFWVSQRLNSVV
ncbi:unnamed protein product [Enterobius vermicularis]|uniref:NtA domain-containing protein n=1 Tax=Enterobius vermicularis TaxID=51028 RepID=A0A0N4UXJ3_ENTVE|nr:unnamed protein product [Enterobius vermicularis]